MKGLILVGGYGTRLRPLTLSVPKPLIQFCNKPIIEYQIRALQKVGVTHVVLAAAYQSETMQDALTRLEAKYSIKISCSIEDQPLQTAGPIKLAESLLKQDEPAEKNPELFYVLNSDIITDYPLEDMLKMHLRHGKEGTICLTKVEDPSMFGVVLTRPSDGLVTCFMEKPQEFVGDNINAGIYLFDRKMINRIELRPTSIEKEVFPAMAQAEELYAYQHTGYWADIGKPRDFLDGMRLYLQAESPPSRDGIVGNVLIHPSAEIGEGCQIGPNVTIDKNCKIGAGCRISNSAIMAKVTIGNYIKIDSSIIGWNSRVKDWVRIDGLTVLGQDVSVSAEVYINAAFVLPYKNISENITEPGKIIL